MSLNFLSFKFLDFMTSVLKANAFMKEFLSVFDPFEGPMRP